MTKKIFVSGLINIETSLKVDSFPINYSPIEYPFYGINSCVSGVGYNIVKALQTLGDELDFYSFVGDDLNGETILENLRSSKIPTNNIIVDNKIETAASVVLVDQNGKRKIYCDLKNLQEKARLNNESISASDYSLAILTNINFNRELPGFFRKNGIKIATDVHVLNNLDDDYNRDFLKNADILFLSNEAVIGKEESFLKELYERYHNEIIVMGCGDKGALMYIGGQDLLYHEPAVAPRGIESTIGAGDALFSSFIHLYNKGYDLNTCLKKAVLFAGMKISCSGGSNGFVKEEELWK